MINDKLLLFIPVVQGTCTLLQKQDDYKEITKVVGLFLPSATKLREGYILRSVCQEFCPGGCLPQCMMVNTPPPPQMATATDGMHPTGMHSCFTLYLYGKHSVSVTY